MISINQSKTVKLEPYFFNKYGLIFQFVLMFFVLFQALDGYSQGACDLSFPTYDIINASCPDANDGEVIINVSCSTCASIEYKLGWFSDNGFINFVQIDDPHFTGLFAGEYQIIVSDTNDPNCAHSVSPLDPPVGIASTECQPCPFFEVGDPCEINDGVGIINDDCECECTERGQVCLISVNPGVFNYDCECVCNFAGDPCVIEFDNLVLNGILDSKCICICEDVGQPCDIDVYDDHLGDGIISEDCLCDCTGETDGSPCEFIEVEGMGIFEDCECVCIGDDEPCDFLFTDDGILDESCNCICGTFGSRCTVAVPGDGIISLSCMCHCNLTGGRCERGSNDPKAKLFYNEDCLCERITIEVDNGSTPDPIYIDTEETESSACACVQCNQESSVSGLAMPPPRHINALSQPYKIAKPTVEGLTPGECVFNSFTGNLFIRIPLFDVSSLGPDLSFSMMYNSGNTRLNYGYGNGWTFNFNLILSKVDNNVLIRRGDGRADLFVNDGSGYISPLGIFDVLREYDIGKYVVETKFGMKYYFDDANHYRVTSVEDRYGNELTIDYLENMPIKITDASGRVLELRFNDGLLTELVDSNSGSNRISKFEYDLDKNLIRIIDPAGLSRNYKYDINRNIIQIADRRSNIVDIDYNENHAVTCMKSSISELNVLYDEINNQTNVSELVSGVIQETSYVFDEFDRVIHIKGNCCGYDKKFEYDEFNNITKIIDSANNEYNYRYDLIGNVIYEETPLGLSQEFEYTEDYNQLSYRKDKGGYESSCVYDEFGNVIEINLPNNVVRSYSYFRNGLLETYKNGEGHVTQYEYDSYGNLVLEERPIGQYLFEYDSYGNQLVSVSPNGHSSYNEYDILNRLIKVKDALGNFRGYKYDENGNLVWIKNERNFISMQFFDAHNRRIVIAEPQDKITQYSYDEKGNLISLVDPNKNLTQFTYNQRNLKTSETNALGNTKYWEYDINGNVIKAIDFNGNETDFVFDSLNRKSATTSASGETTTYAFDAKNNNISITSPDGISSLFDYDNSGRLLSKQHPFKSSTFEYDKNGNLIKEYDALGNRTTYIYDANDQLVEILNALGESMHFQFDANGNKISQSDKSGNVTSYVYDALNRMIATINPNGKSFEYTYDEAGNPISRIDESGNITESVFDELNRVVLVKEPIGEEIFVYDANGNQIQNIDKKGRSTIYNYDPLNRIITSIYADGSSTQIDYDANGNIISHTNEEGESTFYYYNALNQNIFVTNPENETTNFAYDNLGNLEQITEVGGNIIHLSYDKESRLKFVYDELGIISIKDYDSLGNLIGESDGIGNKYEYKYDALNRISSVTDPQGQISAYRYDSNGNLVELIDREENVVYQTYDKLNRRIRQTDQLGNTTIYAYNEIDKLSSITDALGNKTEYKYNNNNKIEQELFADGSTLEYTFDALGNRLSLKDNAGNVINYSYDQRDRLVMIDFPGSNDVQYSYDKIGRILTAINQDATVMYDYDKSGKLIHETLNGLTTRYNYNLSDRNRTITYPSGRVIVESRNLRHEISNISENDVNIVEYEYDNGNRKISKTLANGVQTFFDYNENNWISTIQHKLQNGILVGFNYEYDKEGNKLVEENIHKLAISEIYKYDKLYRLTEFKKGFLKDDTIANPKIDLFFQYDGVGNRTSVIKNGVLDAYTINSMNAYTAVTNSLNNNYSYDANGNQIQDVLFNYSYDFANRLVEVSGDSSTYYVYDPLGRRIEKKSNNSTTKYFYDGWRVLEERNADNNLEVTYVYGDWIDDVITMDRHDDRYYYHNNSIGSIVALTDTTGNVVERIEYESHGKPIIYDAEFNRLIKSKVDNPYFYTGRRMDIESGLYYYRRRFYNSDTGSFLTRDPTGYVDGMSLYNGYFAGGNWNDPFGTTKVKAEFSEVSNRGFSWIVSNRKQFEIKLRPTPATWSMRKEDLNNKLLNGNFGTGAIPSEVEKDWTIRLDWKNDSAITNPDGSRTFRRHNLIFAKVESGNISFDRSARSIQSDLQAGNINSVWIKGKDQNGFHAIYDHHPTKMLPEYCTECHTYQYNVNFDWVSLNINDKLGVDIVGAIPSGYFIKGTESILKHQMNKLVDKTLNGDTNSVGLIVKLALCANGKRYVELTGLPKPTFVQGYFKQTATVYGSGSIVDTDPEGMGAEFVSNGVYVRLDK